MRIEDLNWMDVEKYLEHEDRLMLVTGATEQHGYLSLLTDIRVPLALADAASQATGVLVAPPLNFGVSTYFLAYPGTFSLRASTLNAAVEDIVRSAYGHGFRRILIVNGHGGNQPAQAVAGEWMADHPGLRVKFHNWWNAPQVWAKVLAIDPVASHASWMENFPWTRLAGVTLPEGQKEMADMARLRLLNPDELRAYLGDGNYGGRWARPDEEMLALWQAGVLETRELIGQGWD